MFAWPSSLLVYIVMMTVVCIEIAAIWVLPYILSKKVINYFGFYWIIPLKLITVFKIKSKQNKGFT